MAHVLINQYLGELAKLREVSGTTRESVVREAFKDLLKSWGRGLDLTFVPEYEIESPAKERRYVDGALLYGLRLPFGYWEAKDEKDDLDAEIEHKFKRGYPQDNIVFEDSREAVLIQNRREVLRCAVDDVDGLQRLLELFFGYERPEVAQFRKAVEQFKADLPAVCEALRAMIDAAYAGNATFAAAADRFLKQAQESINPSLGPADVREILIQHILTEEIFALVFPASNYHEGNNVARELYKLEATFFTGNTKHQTLKALEPYYAAIRGTAAAIAGYHEKQAFLKSFYEDFYKVYNPKAADRLGVVYTPGEIVRFMIDATDWLCEQHFGRNLVDRDVEILDPATGTGTFICELLEHFRGQPAKLKHKYLEELHANEVAILPYYVANLNIEATYAAIAGEYLEYPNLCFVDTLDNVAGLRRYTGQQVGDLFGLGEENIERIKRQNRRRISVVIGNPPYNANQANENDNNKNRAYPEIDARIKDTYIKASTAQKTKLYDMYARFFRWASDRIAENGVVAFVTNRSFVDKRGFDGFRSVIAKEFDEAWVVDLGGGWKELDPNADGGNVFGIGTGVAISFLIRKQSRGAAKPCRIRYVPAGRFAVSGPEKLAWLSKATLAELPWTEIRADAKHNWINLTDNDFDTLIPVATKAAKTANKPLQERAIFKLFSLGVVTARDEWVYGESAAEVRERTSFLVDVYNADLHRASERRKALDASELTYDMKWTRAVKQDLAARKRYTHEQGNVINACYRPFRAMELHFNGRLVEVQYQQTRLFGEDGAQRNVAIVFTDAGSQKPFMALGCDHVFDYHFVGAAAAANGVPLYRYESGNRIDNITDWALKQFRDHYKNAVAPAKAGVHLASAVEGKMDSGFRRNDEQEAKTLDPGLHGNGEEGQEPDSRPRGNDEQGEAEPSSGAARHLLPEGEGKKAGRAKARPITRMDIFHYVYAVLHDPVYREKYAQNLKREFPRIPFYPDFWRWADWGRQLMELHIGYESVEPWPLQRIEAHPAPDNAEPSPVPLSRRERGSSMVRAEPDHATSAKPAKGEVRPTPKALLRADKEHGRIALDSETTLAGVPAEAWDYRLGNRSALEWILDQYKEKKPKDPTIRAKFNTYRFADYKDKVIDLLARVTRVSVETRRIVDAMRAAPR